MAGGEKAKSSGEYGEQIVKNILDMMGWSNANNGVTVPCVHKEKHKKENVKETQKHGIDYVYTYKSQLRDATKQDVLVSVKCRDGYPATENGIKNKFKEFVQDLAYAMECYPACELARKKITNTDKKVMSGLIFWIDRNREDGRENESVVDKIGNFYMNQECSYDTIALIDNKRAQFLYQLLSYAHAKYGKKNVEFFYIDTGLNNSSLQRVYRGKEMPYEYINSNVIPLAISDGDQKKLFIGVADSYCKEYLERLIGLALELTSTWATRVTIAFPDYNSFEHNDEVVTVKSSFENVDFVKNIEVITYKPDFRDEVI